MLQNLRFTSRRPIHHFISDLSTSISVDSFTTGYNVAFVNLLSKYGAIGSNGDSVVADVLTGSLSDDLDDNSDLLSKTRTSNYLSYLATTPKVPVSEILTQHPLY